MKKILLAAVVSMVASASTALAEREPPAREPTHEPEPREPPRDTPADKALEKIAPEWHDVHTEAQRRDDQLRDFHFGHSENAGPVRGEGAPSGNHEPHEHEHFDR